MYETSNKNDLEIRKKVLNNVTAMENGKLGIRIEKPKTRQKEKEELVLLPEQVSALVLLKIRQAIENFRPGRKIRATVGVPAVFGDEQRTATMDAIRMAGIDLIELVNEPTAAARA